MTLTLTLILLPGRRRLCHDLGLLVYRGDTFQRRYAAAKPRHLGVQGPKCVRYSSQVECQTTAGSIQQSNATPPNPNQCNPIYLYPILFYLVLLHATWSYLILPFYHNLGLGLGLGLGLKLGLGSIITLDVSRKKVFQ